MESNALIALFKHVAGLNILPVYFPNVTRDTSGNTDPQNNHARVQVINTTPQTLTISTGKSRYTWILQVDIYCRAGTGIIQAMNYAEQYKDGLPFGSNLVEGGDTFKTITAGEIIPYMQDEAWVIIPVQFRTVLFK